VPREAGPASADRRKGAGGDGGGLAGPPAARNAWRGKTYVLRWCSGVPGATMPPEVREVLPGRPVLSTPWRTWGLLLDRARSCAVNGPRAKAAAA